MNRFILTALALLAFTSIPALAEAPPSQFFNVRQYGAAGNGTTADTGPINRAVEACAAAGGGTVYFTAGTYLTGTVILKSNVTLFLDAGATLLGSKDLADYRTAIDGQQWYDALVLAVQVHNVAIVGSGTIDGNRLSNPDGEEHIRGPHAVLFYDSQDITIRDLTIRDAGNYGLIVRSSQGLTVDGLKVHGGWDGINMHDVLNATISNCRLFTGDDALAGAYWENVTVTNCILNSAANGIRVGGRNVLFSNSVIYGPAIAEHGTSLRHRTEAGFQILPNRGGVSNKYAAVGPIDNMILSGVTMINVGTPFFVAYSADAPYSQKSLGVGRIIVNNLTALNVGKTPFYISAPQDDPAKSIVLSNVRMTFQGDADETQSEGQGFSPFSILQSYGVYARNVASLELHDVRVSFSHPDKRPALFGQNVGMLELDRFYAERASEGAPYLELDGNTVVKIDGKKAAEANASSIRIDVPKEPLVAGAPICLHVQVVNHGDAGLAEVALQVNDETLHRIVWLNANETADVSFLNVRVQSSGAMNIRARDLAKKVNVVQLPASHPPDPPFQTAANTSSEFGESGSTFWIRAEGDYPVMQYADEYGAIFEKDALPADGSVIIRLDNPELRTSWQGRTGIMVRGDIGKPKSAGPYIVLASSPAAGSYLEWATGSGVRLSSHTEFGGYTVWPHWLKLERHGANFIGFSSTDGKNWIEIGKATLPGAVGALDAGMFAFRSAASFDDFQISK